VNTHFWREHYEPSGYKEPPTENWDEYWSSIKKAQKELEKAGKKGIYGMGFPVGDTSPSDACSIFAQIARSLGAEIFTRDLKLNVEDPKTRKAIAQTFEFYTGLYKEGYIPPGAVAWDDGGNNNAFHTKKIVMTANNTLSIPAYQYSESKENYYEKSFTEIFPVGPEGIKTLEANVRTVAIFKGAPHKEVAKEFLEFFMKKYYTAWIKGNVGRFAPTLKSVAQDPFFQKGFVSKKWPVDPHIPKQVEAVTKRPVVPTESGRHPAYADVIGTENIYPKLMLKIINEGMPIDKATDEVIKRFKTAYERYPIK
jgi:multiple sugar transport system substrate-binding protein